MQIASTTWHATRHEDCPSCQHRLVERRGDMSGETGALRGTNILIVEDEALLGLDLALTLGDEGADVEGPVRRLGEALALDGLDTVDAAILDVDIAGDEIFAFADRLREMRVPIVFHTGRADLSRLASEYPEAPIVRKPSATLQVVQALVHVIARASPTLS